MSGIEHFLTTDLARFGLWAVYISMTLESACIPIPSEIVMPYAGILVAEGRFNLWTAVLVGSLANLTGSLIAYFVGRYGGRAFLTRYGKYIFLSQRHLAAADRWFERRGEITVLVARVLPAIRTFISLPAGITRMNIVRFSLYSLLGALPWNFALAYLGWLFADKWGVLQNYFHRFNSIFYVFVVVAVIAVWFWQRRRHR